MIRKETEIYSGASGNDCQLLRAPFSSLRISKGHRADPWPNPRPLCENVSIKGLGSLHPSMLNYPVGGRLPCSWEPAASLMAAASHIHIVNFPFPSLHAKLAFKNRNQRAGLTDEESSHFISYDAINYVCPQFPVGHRLPLRLDFFLLKQTKPYLSVPISQTLFPVVTLLITFNSQVKLKLSIRD